MSYKHLLTKIVNSLNAFIKVKVVFSRSTTFLDLGAWLLHE
jgi:hypothetical protein